MHICSVYALLSLETNISSEDINIDKLWDKEDDDSVFTNMMMQSSTMKQMMSQLIDELHNT